jgi:hypothetical protein
VLQDRKAFRAYKALPVLPVLKDPLDQLAFKVLQDRREQLA